MPDRSVLEPLVDAPAERSVSFAPPQATAHPPADRPAAGGAASEDSDVVQLGRGGPLRDVARAFPVQLAKVQPPALRAETLARPRLLDWLAAKLHHRVILLIADAGFGKTTLLADFSRRTRVRTLWYRLDPDDRDWSAIVHHLVAAGREHDPAFAPTTASLLSEIGVGGPSREAVVDTFIRELGSMADGGTLLIFDDFHLVDDAPDARYIARELIARAPERLTVAFASRRQPTIPLGRLRAVGEVAEVSTDDLRFDATETAQLFTETYGRSMDPDVLHDLAVRTEGWIASLQLVQAALRNRTPLEIRQFVRDLSGADSNLYDYLAEEVVGDLPADLQRYLMTTAILQIVTPEMAEVVSDQPPTEVARLTVDAERLTLLSRVSGGPRTHLRYHPLVRGFLEARLRSVDGDEAVDALHRRAGAAAAATDWRVAAHHYREANDLPTMLEVINDAIPTIMGNAQYSLAAEFVLDVAAESRPVGALLVLGRMDLQHGHYADAAEGARRVLDDPNLQAAERDYALLNLLASSFNSGDGENALQHAELLRNATSDDNLRGIAEATIAILLTRTEADLEGLSRQLQALAESQRRSRPHHFGVTQYNLALILQLQDRLAEAERDVDEALGAFATTSAYVERHAAKVLKASILVRVGEVEAAASLVRGILDDGAPVQNDALIDAADAFGSYGHPALAAELLEKVGDRSAQTVADRRLSSIAEARFHLRDGNFREARDALELYPHGTTTVVGTDAAWRLLCAHADLLAGEPFANANIREAHAIAAAAGFHATRRVAALLIGASESQAALSSAIVALGDSYPWHLTSVAEVISPHLETLDAGARSLVGLAAARHPDRWRAVLRARIEAGEIGLEGASILESIGQLSDVPRLRKFARSHRRSRRAGNVGKALARRLAHSVFVEDQGRVSILIGETELPGSTVRRKVLAMLCFLLSRSGASATRDQVLDALWPDLDPEVAANSLNQTVYFLRRVFEEDYSEDMSPGYVHHDGDIIWLDPELVSSRTIQVRTQVRQMSTPPQPSEVERLVETYRGRFALDFEYEEWASGPRDHLHAAYLEIVERAVVDDIAAGHFDRAIRVARRVLDVDPSADQIEVALLRLYRSTGAHAAAAEQYAHYAAYVRNELGAEPPTLESL
jgi:LuxR family maltose regulon positive regulatory protein